MPLPTSKIQNPLLPFPIEIELASYTLLCYRIPLGRVKAFLPAEFEPVKLDLDGQAVTWLSIFFGRNVLRGVGPLPALPLHFEMCNYRLYVEDPTQARSLYIFRSLISLPPAVLGMRMVNQFPGDYQPYRLDYDARGTTLDRVSAEIGPDGDEFAVTVEGTGEAPDAAGFESPEAAVDYLGNVPVAYFPRWDKRYGKMVTTHPPLKPTGGRVLRADLSWLVNNQMLTKEEAANPASVFMQAKWPFPTYI